MNSLLSAAGPWAPVVVFALAAAESAAFVGLVIPGELAVILGGVVAGTGAVPLWVMIFAAVLGAVIGDSIGYYLGHRMGPALLRQERMKKVSQYMDRASRLLSERGWWALVVARFASVLRAVVPFAAGMGRMPYSRFLLGNVVGGIAWGATFTVAGYLAGANYATVESWFRTGGLAVVGLAVLVGGIVWLTRWAQRNRPKVDALLERARNTPPARALRRITGRTGVAGLALVVTAGAIVASTWLFAALIQDILGSDDFFFFDLSSIRYLSDNPIPQLVTGARVVNAITDPRVRGRDDAGRNRGSRGPSAPSGGGAHRLRRGTVAHRRVDRCPGRADTTVGDLPRRSSRLRLPLRARRSVRGCGTGGRLALEPPRLERNRPTLRTGSHRHAHHRRSQGGAPDRIPERCPGRRSHCHGLGIVDLPDIDARIDQGGFRDRRSGERSTVNDQTTKQLLDLEEGFWAAAGNAGFYAANSPMTGW